MSRALESGGRHIEISNPDKVFFPESGITKGDLVEYYDRVGDVMAPHAMHRPIAMHRFPDGIQSEGFFAKQAPDYFPDWIARATLDKEDGTVTHVVCEEKATLVYLADQGCITPHTWLSQADRPRHPDRMIFDLDPPEGSGDVERLHDVVAAIGRLLDDLDVEGHVMTTGSSGYHVVLPLDASGDFEEAHGLARRIAGMVVERLPDLTTVAQRKDQREDKIFVDYLRNSYAQTTVAPYGVRALPSAPVATPIAWDELRQSEPRAWTVSNMFRRLGQTEDPWRDLPAVSGVAVADLATRIDELEGRP